MEHLYANTVRYPKSESVRDSDTFFVCEKIGNEWHIIEGHETAEEADKAMKILSHHDLVHGHISDINYYRVVKRGLYEIR
jgi:hypothetical protein